MPGQPPGRHCWSSAAHGAQLLAHQRPGGGALVVLVDLVERRRRPRRRCPCAAAPGPAPAAPAPRLRCRLSTHCRAKASSSIRPTSVNRSSSAVGQLVGDVLLGQLVGELLAGAGLTGQRVEQDLAADRLGVGLRLRRTRRRPWRPRAVLALGPGPCGRDRPPRPPSGRRRDRPAAGSTARRAWVRASPTHAWTPRPTSPAHDGRRAGLLRSH